MSTVAERRQQLRSLPWYQVQHALRFLRRLHVSQPRPTGVYLHVDETPASLTPKLCRQAWHPNWELSAYYKSEDFNLSRPDHEDEWDIEHPLADRVEYTQTHCRGWEEQGGLSLRAHYEPAPSEHPKAHLTSEFSNVPKGMDVLREQLELAGVEYSKIKYR